MIQTFYILYYTFKILYLYQFYSYKKFLNHNYKFGIGHPKYKLPIFNSQFYNLATLAMFKNSAKNV